MVDRRRSPPAEIIETHISTVMLVGDRAYKLLKPIRTAYLDHLDPQRRADAIDRELELNRRFAPDVYLGTADLVEHGEPADRMLIMRRLPPDRCLSALIGSPEFEPALRVVAKFIAQVHSALDPVDVRPPLSTVDGLAAMWTSSFDEMERTVGIVIDRADFQRCRQLATNYLSHAAALFDARWEAGLVRDGHGDLTADDIFVMDDGPRVLDCLAFDDDYRVADVLADVAFLVMDVERLAGPDAARSLMRAYCVFSGEHHPASLAHHWVAYRAHVRAKVNLLRYRQGDASAAERARSLHRQALDHLERARLRVVVVGGAPGTGKTTTANGLAERLNWAVISSDTVRKDLRRVDHDVHDVTLHPDLYDTDTTAATYDELGRQASQLLEAGVCVVVDATWADRRHRAAIRRVAHAHGADVDELVCELDAAEARRRIAARIALGGDASDATPSLVDAFTGDAWRDATTLDTTRRPETVVDRAVEALFPDTEPTLFEGGCP